MPGARQAFASGNDLRSRARRYCRTMPTASCNFISHPFVRLEWITLLSALSFCQHFGVKPLPELERALHAEKPCLKSLRQSLCWRPNVSCEKLWHGLAVRIVLSLTAAKRTGRRSSPVMVKADCKTALGEH